MEKAIFLFSFVMGILFVCRTQDTYYAKRIDSQGISRLTEQRMSWDQALTTIPEKYGISEHEVNSLLAADLWGTSAQARALLHQHAHARNVDVVELSDPETAIEVASASWSKCMRKFRGAEKYVQLGSAAECFSRAKSYGQKLADLYAEIRFSRK